MSDSMPLRSSRDISALTLPSASTMEFRQHTGSCVLCEGTIYGDHYSSRYCSIECRRKVASLKRAARKAGRP